MKLEYLEKLDGAMRVEWDTFIYESKNQHPRQFPLFADIEKAEGRHPCFVIGTENERICAAALVSRIPHKLLMGKYSYATILSGPICDDTEKLREFLTCLINERVFNNAGRIFVSPYWLASDAEKAQKILAEIGFKSAEKSSLRKTGLVDLKRSEQEILASFSKSARREVRRAERMNVTVTAVSRKEEYVAFLKILNQMRKLRNLSVLDESTMGFSFDHFYKHGNHGVVLCAWHDNILLAGLQIYRSKDMAHGRHFAGDNDKLKDLKNLRISPLLWFEGMKWAKDSGCSQFDLEGYNANISKGDSRYFIYKYKGEFSPQEISRVAEHYIVINPIYDFPGDIVPKLKVRVKRILNK
ncbi:MAG: peptidoglycan bridge formation glycyltransferase FemA/FemB family protein [Sneathiella sp.]|uniref:lipid II:glycine glycyltransferase FemX n=1 Tax=Sneathiella sp. TaxID=1964365 RepID=UPI00300262AC